ncbi:sulfotransferase [Achlya hypogyna]|uniref:Sulfotransferase n=1 Tax=Achlya hypogyna TaxID=1202772 RepID=A0A1V9YAK2_ACHHY|nr:sulfotransferase [Achlya hypogyna]
MLPPPRFNNLDGFLVPGSYAVEHLESARTLKARAGDVFVCSYPDCGTDYVLRIVYGVLNNAVEPIPDPEKVVPHVERVGKDAAERMTAKDPARLFKTHLPSKWTPYHPQAKYICVGRNPKDTSVAHFYRTREYVEGYHYENGQWDDYFELFLAGQVDFGDYFDFFLPWFTRKDEDNVLFLTYEYLADETRDAILRIARFLGDEYEDRVLEHREHRLHVIVDSLEDVKAPLVQLGDWKTLYSADQSERMLDRFHEKTKGTSAQHMWADLM